MSRGFRRDPGLPAQSVISGVAPPGGVAAVLWSCRSPPAPPSYPVGYIARSARRRLAASVEGNHTNLSRAIKPVSIKAFITETGENCRDERGVNEEVRHTREKHGFFGERIGLLVAWLDRFNPLAG